MTNPEAILPILNIHLNGYRINSKEVNNEKTLENGVA